jgi:chromosome segregation protein
VYLKRLTISGFKSFANKTVLEFEAGMSVVVGPNGAGKSNVADAVRWALGEQSVRLIRAKKGEEVIFAGTEKRPKASMAEVSLLLDNAHGSLDLNFSEIELVRRLYRSGESEYRLNGRKVALRDIQHLLMQAGFGPNSYAVIGQGMIDQLILASPTERKLLFEEASGIRGFELKREQAGRKLEATDANLVRVRDILSELEPRLAALARGAEAVKVRQQLNQELDMARANYVLTAEAYYSQERISAYENITKLKQLISNTEQVMEDLQNQKESLASKPSSSNSLTNLHEVEAKRDHLSNELSVKKAEQQFLFSLERGLADAKRLRQALTKAVAEAQVAEAETSARLGKAAKTIDRMQARLASLRRQSDQTSRHEYITQALTILKQASHDLGKLAPHENVRLLVYKAGRLLSHATRGQEDVVNEIRTAQTDLMAAMRQRDDAHEPYANAVINLRSLELDLAQAEEQVAKLADQFKEFKRFKKQMELAQQQIDQRNIELSEIEQALARTNDEVIGLRQKANESSVQHNTNEIFLLATKIESTKSDLASWCSQLEEAKQTLEEADRVLAETASRRKTWFANKDLLDSLASFGHPEHLLRQLELLEARLVDEQGNDIDVLEEYQSTAERHRFLSEQVTDLETAQLDLQTIVATLDKQIKAKFETAFAELGKHFEIYFKQLFGGGKASLVLISEAEGYGIEIKAVPPGKRVESLATLSGGERALTGTALLAAILTVNPSPFVVLDEIDAALDEANSSRLSQILSDLTKYSQLIAITHNRQIMATAKTLYGVTMDENHVSKLLSVRLEAATQMAAR